MKVCKKVKLLTKDKDGLFVKNDTYKVLRERAVISEQSVKDSEAVYKQTGVLWVIDEEATKEWHESKIEEKPKRGRKSKTE